MLNSLASAGRRALPNQWDLIAFAAILAILTAIAKSYHGISAPLPAASESPISLDYWQLPYYALRTTLRMFAALAASLIFTFTYATLAAKSRRAEMILIPLLDILQSVPVLGFLSFTVTFFLGLFPGNTMGAELAAVFAIFTSQAWNMAFSFYQSLRTVPADLDEVARGFRLTGWQKFWQLEAPFAMPGLIWNTMMSMSGGWFFVVASEAITVGDTTITLPGVGSFIAKANDAGNWSAIGAAVLTMGIVILLYDQLLFRPIVAWAAKFRVELSVSQDVKSSWVLNLIKRTFWLKSGFAPIAAALRSVSLWPVRFPTLAPAQKTSKEPSRLLDVVWILIVIAVAAWAAWLTISYIATELSWDEVGHVFVLTFYTLIRVVALMLLATSSLGPDQRLDRPQASLGGGHSADRPIPCRFPGQPSVRRGGQPRARLPPEPEHLAELPHRLRHAMVYRLQHDRRRGRLSQRLARSRGELSHSRLALVDSGDDSRHRPVLFDRRDHRVGGLLERVDRRRIRQVERSHRRRAGRRIVHRPGHGQGRLSENCAGRRDDVAVRDAVQPPVLATALRLRGAAAAPLTASLIREFGPCWTPPSRRSWTSTR